MMFQPSEIGKLAAVVALAWWFSRYEQRSSQLLHGFILPMLLIGVLMGLIVREEDLGATLLIGVTMVAIMFVAGSNPIYMVVLGLAMVGGIWLLAHHMHERAGRLDAFWHLEQHKDGKGLQQWEALKAFGSGGLFGLGLGESREKIGYLPYAHTDFIFPIIGEELGLRATLFVIFTFLSATLSGILIAMQARDRFGMLLGFGLVINIALQASVNIGMTTALLPNKGMPLPFISSGGSNLCLCLLVHRRLAEHLPAGSAGRDRRSDRARACCRCGRRRGYSLIPQTVRVSVDTPGSVRKVVLPSGRQLQTCPGQSKIDFSAMNQPDLRQPQARRTLSHERGDRMWRDRRAPVSRAGGRGSFESNGAIGS